MNRLSQEQRLAVLWMLVEGNSLRSASRMTGIHRTTIMNVMVETGEKCRGFMDRWMQNLALAHLECDEIWTFVKKKQRKLTGPEKNKPTLGDQYLFIAFDLKTKLSPCFAIGKRTADVTDALMLDLASRLMLPELFESGPRAQISTDGFTAYPDAIDEAFAGLADYGQIIKAFTQTESRPAGTRRRSW